MRFERSWGNISGARREGSAAAAAAVAWPRQGDGSGHSRGAVGSP